MTDTPNTSDKSDQPQGGNASDQGQPKSDSSGTKEVKGNDPVTKEEGANVQLVQVDERGYLVKVQK
ncbi:hypothetical protein BHE90_017314 [Fusarium euwallaceae]|uniref:Uncharacterized protein n=1 Tax=Fusarium euwallaceae TaxID=1147111 RepID=A0A430KXV4_9HYPO|nr:hypothetical protein BHE90_017314 [Fusarium euwallaceae]